MFNREDSRPADASARGNARAPRAALLMGTALGCSVVLAVADAPAPAYAAPNDACGSLTRSGTAGVPDQVTCTSSGNNYTLGINYDEQLSSPALTTPHDLTVVLEGSPSPVVVNSAGPGVVVTNLAGFGATAQINDSVQITSAGGGIYAVATGTGAAVIQSNGASVTAVGAGLHAYNGNGGDGAVQISNSAKVTVTQGAGTYAAGILAGITHGAASVTNSGAITVTGTRAVGIGTDAYTQSTVTNNVGGTIKVTGVTSAVGVNAGETAPQASHTTSVTNYADITAVTTGAAGTATGVQANSTGGTTVTSKSGTISASGYNAFGVNASASGGGVTVKITGGTVGAYASGTNAPSGAGIYAKAAAGAATVYGATTNTTGLGITGIKATGQTGVYVNTGAVTTTGKNALGVDAYSAGGSASVKVSGAIKTSGANATGVSAYAKAGDVTVSTASAVSVTGDDAQGVRAISGHGNVGVTLNGAVSTSGKSAHSKYSATAVYAAAHEGTVSVTGSGPITASGASSNAVMASSLYGTTVNLSGAVTASGAPGNAPFTGVGVAAFTSEGDTNVTVGSVTATGAGVLGLSAGGSTSVTVNGAVTSGKYGVLAASLGQPAASTTTVTVSNGASVSGYSGVLAIATGDATVTNSGTISGSGKYSVGVASETGAATLNNTATGVVNGPVTIYGGASSTFNNAGVWNAWGSSYIGGNGAPAGVMNNSGTVYVAPGTTTATTVSVAGLGTWNNSGTIDIRNGHTGDVFDLGTAAFNGLAGSKLKVDASLSGHVTADEVTAGAVTGSTVVSVADTTPTAAAAFDFTGATIFKGTSGTQSNFGLAGGYLHKGFVNYSIYFNPSAVTWNLVGLPGHAVFESLKLVQAGQNFAERSDDVWYWRTQEIRDAEALGARRDGWQFWGQVYGGSQNLDQTQGFAVSPFHFSEDLSTRNEWAGVQLGVDHLSSWRGGKLLYGFMAGYLEQWTDFRGGARVSWGSGVNAGGFTEAAGARDQFDLHGVNIAAYVGYTQGGWFLNGMAKADFAGVDLHLNSVPLQAATNATTWSLNGEGGYRYGGPGLFIEPLVKVTLGDTSVDSWTGGGATAKYPDNNNLQTSVGARFGGAVGSGPVVLTPYVGAYWVNESFADNRMSFDAGGTTLNLRDTPLRSYGRIDAGFTAKAPHGLEGFAKVIADTGSGVSGVSGDVGVRWRW